MNAAALKDLKIPGSPLVTLGEVAARDPRLAYTLLQGGCSAGGYVDTGGWEILNLIGEFTAGTANDTVNGRINGIVEADLWVRDVTYTVRRPEAFAGSIFKGQSDYYNSLSPNIDFTLLVKSWCKYVISPQNTPLENIRQRFFTNEPAGMVLRMSSQIQATYTCNRALADDEIPTQAIISLHCLRLPMDVYGSCSREQAVAVLQSLEVLPDIDYQGTLAGVGIGSKKE